MTRRARTQNDPRGAFLRARAVRKARRTTNLREAIGVEEALTHPYSNLGEFLYDAAVMGA